MNARRGRISKLAIDRVLESIHLLPLQLLAPSVSYRQQGRDLVERI